MNKRPSYEYEIDGIVFKVDELDNREKLGLPPTIQDGHWHGNFISRGSFCSIRC